MSYAELHEIECAGLRDQWVAIDPRGPHDKPAGERTGYGIALLRSGALIVDSDHELGTLCRRLADAQMTSLTIVYCGDSPRC